MLEDTLATVGIIATLEHELLASANLIETVNEHGMIWYVQGIIDMANKIIEVIVEGGK